MMLLFDIPICQTKLKEAVIRALWWKQPFASLMLKGKIETRTYSTSVRGKVLICATKKPYSFIQLMKLCGRQIVNKIFFIFQDADETWPKDDGLPNGVAIAIADLVDCRLMTKQDEPRCFVQYREPWIEERPCVTPSGLKGVKFIKKELWCWVFENVEEIEPFEINGKQGWATLTEEEKVKIKIKAHSKG